MAKKILEGSHAVAEAVKLCRPHVLGMYPITPSTHIPERLAEFVNNGELSASLIRVEAEFSAISSIVGAAAAGSRVFTATSSQGLALMHEVLYAASGMRLPMVMVVANRALSAPINIWNDWQDAISERENGWIQLFVENVQEAVDTVIQAYRITEDERVYNPVMVNMDGFYLTHVYEPVDIPDQKDVDEFLPPLNYKYKLDPKKPLTHGPFAYPVPYAMLRKKNFDDFHSFEPIVKEVHDEFAKKFGRSYGDGIIEEYKNDRPITIVTMGSISGTVKELVDSRDDVGLVRIRLYRPFPKERVAEALEGKEMVLVIEKDVAMGSRSGALFLDIRDALFSMRDRPRINNAIGGIGGTDITRGDIAKAIDELKEKDGEIHWFEMRG